ncbi:hypothetical protein [Desulfosoma sp.]|uniref:hypothetical protein n=1 Tax=Desulfosoma sp. TaxID=2603217 RepID=UPI004049D4BA
MPKLRRENLVLGLGQASLHERQKKGLSDRLLKRRAGRPALMLHAYRLANTGRKMKRVVTPRQGRRLVKYLRNPLFPLYFLERNLGMLLDENGMRTTSARRTAQWATVVWERIRWFQELVGNGKVSSGVPHSASVGYGLDDGPDRVRIETYCDHCGLCCEICSGFPDFPDPNHPPDAWRFVFGQGLGYGHRFCPFLLHDRRAGRSFCAIHRHRPNPCRIFEEDECQTVKTELKSELARTRGRPPRFSGRIGRLVKRALHSGRPVRLLLHQE